MSESLHHRLRTATAVEHERLERDLDWESRVATLDGYRSLLMRFRGFHAACEPAIGHALDDEAFFGPRRRLARLDADLAFLGLDHRQVAALPSPDIAILGGPAEALGALYVLEGSTLGGQVIAKRIARVHGFDAMNGCAYYSAHGRAASAMWAAFCGRLDALSDPSHAQAALRVGVATFALMRSWLTIEPEPVAALGQLAAVER